MLMWQYSFYLSRRNGNKYQDFSIFHSSVFLSFGKAEQNLLVTTGSWVIFPYYGWGTYKYFWRHKKRYSEHDNSSYGVMFVKNIIHGNVQKFYGAKSIVNVRTGQREILETSYCMIMFF